MVSAKEFREYADECMRSAKTVRSDKELKALLRMAEAWLEAADLLERQLKTDSARSIGLGGGLQMTLDSSDGLDAKVGGSLHPKRILSHG
jgi:hypothetical protein